jgi:biopolymer transport protein TolQ
VVCTIATSGKLHDFCADTVIGNHSLRSANDLVMNPDSASMSAVSATGSSIASPLDPFSLLLRSSGIVLGVLLILVAAGSLVWLIWILKFAQIRRLTAAQHRFEAQAERATSTSDLIRLSQQHATAPGARIVLELAKHQHQVSKGIEYMLAVGKRATVVEQQRASSLMPTLQSIASASPFISLFGNTLATEGVSP